MALGLQNRLNHSEMMNDRKIRYALEKGISMIELRSKKRLPFDLNYFGYDDVSIEEGENTNTNDVWVNVKIERHSQITFVENSDKVLVAFIPDTPRNRRKLAISYYVADYIIARLITPTNDVMGSQFILDIKALADELNIKPPVHVDPFMKRKQITEQQQKDNAAVTTQNSMTSKILSQEDAEEIVHAKYPNLIAFLRGKHGNFKDNDVYESSVWPEVVQLCSTNGIIPRKAKPILQENIQGEQTKEVKPNNIQKKEPVKKSKGNAKKTTQVKKDNSNITNGTVDLVNSSSDEDSEELVS